MEKTRLALDEVMEAADRLRGMMDDEQNKSVLLKKRNKELELLLMQNDITIPNYEMWHDVLPMA